MFKKFIIWIKPTLEDNNGQASYRRFTSLIFTILICYMVFFNLITNQLTLNSFYALLLSDLLLIGIVTTQNIITFIKGYNSNSSKNKEE